MARTNPRGGARESETPRETRTVSDVRLLRVARVARARSGEGARRKSHAGLSGAASHRQHAQERDRVFRKEHGLISSRLPGGGQPWHETSDTGGETNVTGS